MKYLVAAGLAVLLAGCGERTTLEVLPDVVRDINESGSAEISKQIPGATMKARIDDGKTLVLMIGNVPLGNTTYDPNAMRKTLRPQICGSRNYRELIEDGGKVRVEMTTNYGKELPAVQFARCG